MAPAVTEFWRSVATDDIDTSLPDLWIEAARESPVSRALMSNLVVVRQGARPVEAGAVPLGAGSDLVRIAERHPVRMILLNYVPKRGSPCGPSQASIGVLIFGEGAARYGVEAIAVEAICAEPSVPSIVRRLTRGDVPTTLWWTADLSQVRPPSGMVETGRQFLYDSAAWHDVLAGARSTAEILALSHSPDLADLNWQRYAPLRWAIVHALRTEPRVGTVPTHAVICHRPDERTAGWLLGAWLQRGMQWTGFPTIEESSEDGDMLTVRLSSEQWSLTAAMNRERVLVESSGAPSPFTMPVPALTAADAVIGELRNLGRDRHLRETVATLAERSA